MFEASLYPSVDVSSKSHPARLNGGNANIQAIDELRQHCSWVSWKRVPRQLADGSWAITKPPVDPHTGRGASHSNPATWGTYDEAYKRIQSQNLAGVGFVLSEDDDYTGYDLDKCRDAVTGEIEPWAMDIIALEETYAEVSPSGTGIRLIARGKVEKTIKCDAAHVEIYRSQRYLTITQDHIEGTPLDIRPAPMTYDMLVGRVEDLRSKPSYDLPSQVPVESTLQTITSHQSAGTSFFRSVNDKALSMLGAWVTAIFPAAKFQQGTGGYRVLSRDLGRSLEEDLSFSPQGIKDFGIADIGDTRQGARTAIDIVMAYSDETSAVEAAFWLCERMGVLPDQLGWQGVQASDDSNQSTDAVSAQLNTRVRLEPTPKADPLSGFIFDGDANPEPPPMLVKGLIPLNGICFIGGQSGAGKTFIACDLAVSLASGEAFFNRKIMERVGVIILAAEGVSTIANRIIVPRNKKAEGEILPIAWIGEIPNLANEKAIKELITRLQAVGAKMQKTHNVRVGAIIIDTLAAAFSLKDENDNSEATIAIRCMKMLGDAMGAVVVPVHHYGKAAETGLRGASAWRAGCDAVVSVLADRDQTSGQVGNRRMALTKSRVGEEGWIMRFDLRFVSLGIDEDGEPFGACYVEPTMAQGQSGGETQTSKRPHWSSAAQAYLKALEVVLIEKGAKLRPFGGEGSEVKATDREAVRQEFYAIWPTDGGDDTAKSNARRQAFNRGDKELRKRNRIFGREVNGTEQVWLIPEAAK